MEYKTVKKLPLLVIGFSKLESQQGRGNNHVIEVNFSMEWKIIEIVSTYQKI
jgi:hypothetical protein